MMESDPMPSSESEVPDWMGTFTPSEPSEPYIIFHYELSKRRIALFDSTSADTLREPLLLMTYDYHERSLTMHPKQTAPSTFGSPKYQQLVTITFEGFDLSHDPYGMLEELPAGAVRDPDLGLGLTRECRFIVSAIEEVPQVISLTISKSRQTMIEGTTFILNFKEFDELRRQLDRIHEHAVAEANVDKKVKAFNSLLSRMQPEKFPERQRPYRKDVLFKTVALRQSNLSPKDKESAIGLVEANLKSMSSENPAELLRLKENIELVSVEQLIEKLRLLLLQDHAEPVWQKFLTEHGFVLNLAFHLPVSVIGQTLSIGGRSLLGAGDKIGDFLLKNRLSDNVALIEIKRPSTSLIGRKYRGGVYPPSHELAGAVLQVLDQRYHLQMEIAQLSLNTGRNDLRSYAIQCIVIAGRMPEEADCKKSLELYRNSLVGVTIVTFDELLLKLQSLHELLASTRIEDTSPSTLSD